MLIGKRGPRPGASVHKPTKCLPRGEVLEAKVLLSIDLGGSAPPALPNIASANVGIAMVGTSTPLQGAGYSVANLGSVNGSGFDSYLIGAPAIDTTGSNTASAAYLVFGSQVASTTGPVTSDWLLNAPNGRVGDVAALGSNVQPNPITGTTTNAYAFNGVTFIASQQPNSQLGASVANAGIIRGTQAFLIGAPNGTQAGSTTSGTGTGRAYLVYGSSNLSTLANKTIDLDDPASAAAAGINVVTFVSSALGAQLGSSVAGIGNFLNDGSNSIALGAPSASIGGTATSGAVYVMSSNNLPASAATIDVTQIGQGGVTGLVISGPSGGSQAGFSVGGSGGDVNGDGVADLLVGAPGTGGTSGSAYLVYGGNLISQTTVTNSVRFLSLARVGTASGSTPASVAGAVVAGSTGEQLGFAVAGAGDFNNDGFGDILLGGPGFASLTGRATLIYGGANNVVSGSFTADTIPSGVSSLSLIGTATGDQAGYSLSLAAAVNSGQPNGILIGSPGYLSSRGAAYYLPGHGGLYTGTFSLSEAENTSTLAGLLLTATTPGFAVSTNAPRFGTSVSGRLIASGQSRTGDNDLLGDFVIGAPGFTVINSGNLAGAGFIVEGARIVVGIPPASNVITTTIVQIDNSTTVPFSISATTPNAMQIVVTSSTTPTGGTFNPATDIDPTTVTVNGVLFANATVAADPTNATQAIITISPRSSLNLPSGTSTLVVSGLTNATASDPNQPWIGTTTVNTGGGNNGGGTGTGGVAAPVPPGLFVPSTFVSPFGSSFVPTISALSQFNYAPIPVSVALSQYLPPAGFRQRIQAYHGMTVQGRKRTAGSDSTSGLGPWTLGSSVFSRGRFHNGQTYKWTHSGNVVPVQNKVQKFTRRNNHLPG
ncbi:beta strand repeat-containing protein [Paludisphaera mucosa]|uniref:Integrin alpha n=1 Tax=Paludisphaera mucosa TaxID=3030827 RepID=A0ABT6F7I9_9BACT|nr:integrin alpha [Paludisphaera mucosa]MDG3003494.1 integrin alpha [Paludisphaera mucosa]